MCFHLAVWDVIGLPPGSTVDLRAVVYHAKSVNTDSDTGFMSQGQSEAVSEQLNEEEQLLVISRLHQVTQLNVTFSLVDSQALGATYVRYNQLSSCLPERPFTA